MLTERIDETRGMLQTQPWLVRKISNNMHQQFVLYLHKEEHKEI